MKNDKIKFLLSALFFVVLAVITFRCVWPADHVLSSSASDFNIGQLAARKNVMPEYLTGGYKANQLLGSAGSLSNVFHVVLAILPLEIFANTFYGFFLVLGSVCMVWFLRLWNRSWLASVFGALVAFWVNSITLAHVGHAYKMEVLVFSVLGLCLVEKSVRAESIRRSIGYSILVGLVTGVMIIEQQDVALLAGLFMGAYALFRLIQVHGKKGWRWVALLGPLALVALLLSGRTALGSYNHNVKNAAAVQQSEGGKWDYVTQWSAVPEEWPMLVAPGWAGWSSGNKEGPYWGKIGRNADWKPQSNGLMNLKLDSIYIGVIPFILGGFGLLLACRNRKSEEGRVMLFWGLLALGGLWLAFGKYSFLYKLFYHLPLVNNIRAPIKFLDNFQVCLGVVAAYGLDQLFVDNKSKWGKGLWISGLVLALLLIFAGIKLSIAPEYRMSLFTELGFDNMGKSLGVNNMPELMVENMTHAWFHAGVLALIFSGAVFFAWKFKRYAKWAIGGIVVVLAVDSLFLTSHYFEAVDTAAMKKGNELIQFLKKNQHDERTVLLKPSGPYSPLLTTDGPYHGLNIFNIWQMPRMPKEYEALLGSVKTWPDQLRLWQISAVKYVAAPVGVMSQFQQMHVLDQFKPVKYYRFYSVDGKKTDVSMIGQPEWSSDQVLLQFVGSIPRFTLFKGWMSMPVEQQCETLMSESHDPAKQLLVDVDAGLGDQSDSSGFEPVEEVTTTKNRASMTVNLDAPAILRFSQRYNDGWTVLIDGEEADLLRVDYLCMGVRVPAGSHSVEFRSPSSLSNQIIKLVVVGLSIGVALLLLFKRRNRSSLS